MFGLTFEYQIGRGGGVLPWTKCREKQFHIQRLSDEFLIIRSFSNETFYFILKYVGEKKQANYIKSLDLDSFGCFFALALSRH